MQMIDAFTLEDENGQSISLLESDEDKFQHDIRETLRTKQWTEVAHRRPQEYGGMELPHTDVDRDATMALHSKVKGK